MFWVLGVAGSVLIATYAAYALVPKSLAPIHSAARPPRPSTEISAVAPCPSRSTLPSYSTIGGSLFTPPQPVIRTVLAQKATVVPIPQVPFVAPYDPLADAVYSGSITMDGRTMALIESRTTTQGTYVDQDGEWHAFKALSISPDEVVLSINGTTRRLAKSDTINVVPLSANASGLGPAGTSASTGQVQSGGGVPVPTGTFLSYTADRSALDGQPQIIKLPEASVSFELTQPESFRIER